MLCQRILTRKNDYEEQDLEQTKNSRQSSLFKNEVREGVEKSLASPVAIKSNQECSKV